MRNQAPIYINSSDRLNGRASLAWLLLFGLLGYINVFGNIIMVVV